MDKLTSIVEPSLLLLIRFMKAEPIRIQQFVASFSGSNHKGAIEREVTAFISICTRISEICPSLLWLPSVILDIATKDVVPLYIQAACYVIPYVHNENAHDSAWNALLECLDITNRYFTEYKGKGGILW